MHNISHDAIAMVSVITFADTLDDMPQLTTMFKSSTAETVTEAELKAVITARAKELLSEALRLCLAL